MNEKNSFTETLGVNHEVARMIRHTLSAALSFLDGTKKCLSGTNTDSSTATKLLGYGTEKVRFALTELDKSLEDLQQKQNSL